MGFSFIRTFIGLYFTFPTNVTAIHFFEIYSHNALIEISLYFSFDEIHVMKLKLSPSINLNEHKTNKMIIRYLFMYIWCTIAYCTLVHIYDLGMLSARPIIAKIPNGMYSISQNIRHRKLWIFFFKIQIHSQYAIQNKTNE